MENIEHKNKYFHRDLPDPFDKVIPAHKTGASSKEFLFVF